MRNAPVYFTIAQVRFNPVLSLESYVPGIQESLRKAGYPDFRKLLTMAFNLAPMTGQEKDQLKPPPTQQIERYVFHRMDRRGGVLLDHNALSYQTTDYDTFGVFVADLAKTLEIVHGAVGLSFSERVGLRYLDAVVPLAGETLEQFLAAEVIGLGAKLKDVANSHSFTETLFQFPDVGNVMARTIVRNGPLGFPPDLTPVGLEVAERFKSVTGRHAVIDTDGFFEGREVFNVTTVTNRLSALHDKIDRCFHSTVTDHARTVWK